MRALQTLLWSSHNFSLLSTYFEIVYISFYFQTSQEKIKPSLLTQRTASRGQRVQVSVATVVV